MVEYFEDLTSWPSPSGGDGVAFTRSRKKKIMLHFSNITLWELKIIANNLEKYFARNTMPTHFHKTARIKKSFGWFVLMWHVGLQVDGLLQQWRSVSLFNTSECIFKICVPLQFPGVKICFYVSQFFCLWSGAKYVMSNIIGWKCQKADFVILRFSSKTCWSYSLDDEADKRTQY